MMLLTFLFEPHIIPQCSQAFPVILGLISTSGTILLDNVVLAATVIIKIHIFKLMCYFFNQKTSGLQKYLAVYAHLWYSEEGYCVLEQEIKSLKASELKGFFGLTIRVLIYSTGFFSQTSSDRQVSKEMTTLCRDDY